MLAAMVCAIAYSLGYAIASLGGTAGFALQVWVVAIVLSQRELAHRVENVVAELARGRLARARLALRHIVGRETAGLSRHKIAAAAMESMAENFADAVVAPLFWYLVGGLPMLLLAKAANTLDSMIGYKDQRFRQFGMAAAHLDTALNFIPARISAVVIAMASLGGCGKALRTALADADNHSSLNAGWPEAALAGGCGIKLGGTRRYHGLVARDKPIGDGTAKIGVGECQRGILIYKRSCGVLAGILLLLVIS